jgi:hypothetical protein
MSSHHNRRARRQVKEIPLIVERVKKTEQGAFDQTQSGQNRLTYEEARWPYLSPKFREAHNRLRVARGLSPLPPPKIDLYVKPSTPLIKRIDENDPEYRAALREGLGDKLPGGSEGFARK